MPFVSGMAMRNKKAFTPEHMAQVSVAPCAEKLRTPAMHVTLFIDIAPHVGPKAWPTMVAFKLHRTCVDRCLGSCSKAATAEAVEVVAREA